MATCERETSFASIDLPSEFEDLEGLLHADLQAIVHMLSERANERLFLTGREIRHLQKSLWNGLAGVVSTAMEPLSVDQR